MKTEASSLVEDPHWIKPTELLGWQMLVYKKQYNAGSDSYRLHYAAAVRGNRISVNRMDWLRDKVILERLKGAG